MKKKEKQEWSREDLVPGILFIMFFGFLIGFILFYSEDIYESINPDPDNILMISFLFIPFFLLFGYGSIQTLRVYINMNKYQSRLWSVRQHELKGKKNIITNLIAEGFEVKVMGPKKEVAWNFDYRCEIRDTARDERIYLKYFKNPDFDTTLMVMLMVFVGPITAKNRHLAEIIKKRIDETEIMNRPTISESEYDRAVKSRDKKLMYRTFFVEPDGKKKVQTKRRFK